MTADACREMSHLHLLRNNKKNKYMGITFKIGGVCYSNGTSDINAWSRLGNLIVYTTERVTDADSTQCKIAEVLRSTGFVFKDENMHLHYESYIDECGKPIPTPANIHEKDVANGKIGCWFGAVHVDELPAKYQEKIDRMYSAEQVLYGRPKRHVYSMGTYIDTY